MSNFDESTNPPGGKLPDGRKTPADGPIEREPSPASLGLARFAGEELTFHYRWSDFDEESPTGEEEGEDDGVDGEFVAVVVRLGNSHFQTQEPVSVTPFGPFGPSLALGVVFEAEPFDDGTFRYVRTVDRLRVWERAINVSRQVINQDTVRPILVQVSQLGSKWEWMANTLTIQGLLADGEEDVPSGMSELIDILVSKIIETESNESR